MAPVLFLDSGVGGVAYLGALKSALPRVSTVYVADREMFPYGNKRPADVRGRVLSLAERAIRLVDPQLVVVACNTASVVALAALRAQFSTPFVGVVPAIKPAAAQTRTGHIAVLSTGTTSVDPYTDDLAQRFARKCRVTRLGLGEVVRAAEEGACDERGIRAVIQASVAPIVSTDADVAVLACTHFVAYRDIFQSVLGDSITIVDSVQGVTGRVVDLLGANSDGMAGTEPRHRFMVTGPHLARYSCFGPQIEQLELRGDAVYGRGRA